MTNKRKIPKEKVSLEDVDICQKLIQLRQSAKARNLDFNLSFKTVKMLLTAKKCYYTGVVFEETGDFARSIDRVDNRFGYINDNVVACTVDINSKKSNLDIETLELLYKKASAYLERKK